MPRRRTATAAIGALAPAAGALLVPAPFVGVAVPVATGAALAALWATWPRSRRAVPWASLGVALLSFGTTLIAGRDDTMSSPAPSTAVWILLEPALTLAFVYLPVRWSPPRRAALAAGAAGLAIAVSLQRYLPPEPWWEEVAASALWLVPSIAVALVAWYLRDLEARRHRAVADARREQRFDLAADLHDFVAHDVSEIVAQAQASRLVLADGNPALQAAFDRIERAGLRALSSMDRTVHMLRDQGPTRSPVGGPTDLPALVDRFDVDGTVRVRLTMDDPASVPREPGAVLYRVVVEALTNVRRHAPRATTVDVAFTVTTDSAGVSVVNDGAEGARRNRARAGLGIPGLTERVTALGGTLTAAPVAARRWRLVATIPLPTDNDRGA